MGEYLGNKLLEYSYSPNATVPKFSLRSFPFWDGIFQEPSYLHRVCIIQTLLRFRDFINSTLFIHLVKFSQVVQEGKSPSFREI